MDLRSGDRRVAFRWPSSGGAIIYFGDMSRFDSRYFNDTIIDTHHSIEAAHAQTPSSIVVLSSLVYSKAVGGNFVRGAYAGYPAVEPLIRRSTGLRDSLFAARSFAPSFVNYPLLKPNLMPPDAFLLIAGSLSCQLVDTFIGQLSLCAIWTCFSLGASAAVLLRTIACPACLNASP